MWVELLFLVFSFFSSIKNRNKLNHDDLSPIDHQDWTKVPYASGAALLPALDQVVRELQMSGTKDVKVGKLGFTLW